MARTRRRSRGRGTAAAFGLLLLLGGLIAGGVMLVIASRLHDRAVDDFARAGVGCRTTLDFDGTGTFYVYEERAAGGDELAGDCEPAGEAGQPFGVEQVEGPAEVAFVPDDSIDYDTGDHVGRSVSTFVVEEPGQYEISVRGGDASVVAAIGRDPSDAVDQTRTAAIVVAAAGVVLGGLLLLLAGRRSHRGDTPSVPAGPPSSHGSEFGARTWPPAPPTVAQRPFTPTPPPPPPPGPPAGSPWAPPAHSGAQPGNSHRLPPPPPPPTSTRGGPGGESGPPGA